MGCSLRQEEATQPGGQHPAHSRAQSPWRSNPMDRGFCLNANQEFALNSPEDIILFLLALKFCKVL